MTLMDILSAAEEKQKFNVFFEHECRYGKAEELMSDPEFLVVTRQEVCSISIHNNVIVVGME